VRHLPSERRFSLAERPTASKLRTDVVFNLADMARERANGMRSTNDEMLLGRDPG